MKTKKITYKVRNRKHQLSQVEGVYINLFVGSRHIINDVENYWSVDHIQTGGKIYVCSTYSEARKIGLAFTQACAKPDSTDPNEVIEKTDVRFTDYLYQGKYRVFEDFKGYLDSLLTGNSQTTNGSPLDGVGPSLWSE
jgi:hypothetical protein